MREDEGERRDDDEDSESALPASGQSLRFDELGEVRATTKPQIENVNEDEIDSQGWMDQEERRWGGHA